DLPARRHGVLRLNDLADAVSRVVKLLSDVHVQALGDAYAGATCHSAAAEQAALQAVPVPHREDVTMINQAWAAAPDVSGTAIALALESARHTARQTAAPEVEVVVTGPDSPDAPVR